MCPQIATTGRLRCPRSRSPSHGGRGTEPQRDAGAPAGRIFLAPPPSGLDGTRTGKPQRELCDRDSLLHHAAKKLAESRGEVYVPTKAPRKITQEELDFEKAKALKEECT